MTIYYFVLNEKFKILTSSDIEEAEDMIGEIGRYIGHREIPDDVSPDFAEVDAAVDEYQGIVDQTIGLLDDLRKEIEEKNKYKINAKPNKDLN